MVSLQFGVGLLGESPGVDDAEIANLGWPNAARQRMDDALRQWSDLGRARNDQTCHQAEPLPGPDERYLLDHKTEAVTLAAAGGTRENDDESQDDP
jgi:hypothetical protein